MCVFVVFCILNSEFLPKQNIYEYVLKWGGYGKDEKGYPYNKLLVWHRNLVFREGLSVTFKQTKYQSVNLSLHICIIRTMVTLPQP